MIACPGPIPVAADQPCTTTDRVFAAPEWCIASRAIPAACTAAATTSTSTRNKSAVPTATKSRVVLILLWMLCFQTFLSLTTRASEDGRIMIRRDFCHGCLSEYHAGDTDIEQTYLFILICYLYDVTLRPHHLYVFKLFYPINWNCTMLRGYVTLNFEHFNVLAV